MFNSKTKAISAAVLASVGLAAGQAHAVPTLTVSDGSTTVTVVDGGGGDGCPSIGCVSWVGGVGNWNINILGGFTKPLLGMPNAPHMDLSFNDNYIGTAASTLTILWSDTDFSTINPVAALSDFGGTRGGGVVSVGYADFASTTNTLNALTTPLCTGVFTTASFSNSCSSVLSGSSPYSLTERIILSANGPGQASGDHSLQIPEPSALALLGLGLLGLGVARRRRA